MLLDTVKYLLDSMTHTSFTRSDYYSVSVADRFIDGIGY